MPGGKAPIFGTAPAWCHERTLPPEVGDPQSLLKWRLPEHPERTEEQRRLWRLQTREALARYFAFQRSNHPLTITEREQQIRKARDNPQARRRLDINTRVVLDRRQRYGDPQYGRRGPRWPDPLLPFLIEDLKGIWGEATGRLPGTRDPENGEFPFYEWIADLFQACDKKVPSEGAVRDVLARCKPKKSGP